MSEVTTQSEALESRRQQLARYVMEQAPIIKTYGARLCYNEHGGAVWDLPYNPKFDHAMGGVHGSLPCRFSCRNNEREIP